MGYEIYAEHPESSQRRAADFSAWSIWANMNAPWTGVSVSEMSSLLTAVCGTDSLPEACTALDKGGEISAADVISIFRLTGAEMSEKVRSVFHRAAREGYPVRVVFSAGFGSVTASAYAAKHGSA